MTMLDRKAAMPAEPGARAKGLLAAGGIIGALLASSCCVLPLVLVVLGVSGAWIGTLTALAPYQPVFLLATFGFLAGGFWTVYRRSRSVCGESSPCARPASDRITKAALWSATVLTAVVFVFPYAVALVFDA